MNKTFDIRDKVIVVTGGLGQLGRQFCRTLLDEGAKVAIIDKKEDKKILGKFSAFMKKKRLLFVKSDVTKKSSLEKALRQIKGSLGMPQGLINNAAIDTPPGLSSKASGYFESYPEKVWDAVMDVNLKGLMLCSQVFGGEMARRGQGSIVNISSVYGLVSPDQRIYEHLRKKNNVFYKPAAYSVSKAGLLNLTRYLATYWSDKGVRVNTLTFGGVFNNQDKEFLANYCKKVPLGRMAREDEYNGAIIFLLSDASSYMTGSNLVIDGGWTAW